MFLKCIIPSRDFIESIIIDYGKKYRYLDIPKIDYIENEKFVINNLMFLLINNKFKTMIKHLGGDENFYIWDNNYSVLKNMIITSQKKIICAGKRISFTKILNPNRDQLDLVKNIICNKYYGIIEEVM